MKPLCVELFCGTFGWSAGWLALGGQALGFDIEHLPHHGPVPDGAQLVLQDVLTLDGAQFKDASLILASPPCQQFSCTGLPFKQFRGLIPDTALFNACFRIQCEASAAAGRNIPLIVENVRAAQKWVGRSHWHHGSFHLWGDVPALMPFRKPAEGRKLDGNNSPRLWKDRRIQRLRDAQEHPFYSSGAKSRHRKAASAAIARIPYALSLHIAQCYFPQERNKNP